MTEPAQRHGHGARARLPRVRLRLARWALIWERLWPALWPATLVTGAFVALALSDLLPLLPGWLHLALLIGFAAALVVGFLGGVAEYRPPDMTAARRRLETDSGIPHRPLTALTDRLAGGRGSPAAAALWQAHLRRVAAGMRRLRVGLPRAGLAARDPLALRALIAMLLVIGAVAAREDAGDRLWRALRPDLSGLAGAPAARLDLWITPPSYTGAAPIFIGADGAPVTEITTAEGSAVLAQVTGGRGQPALHVGRTRTPFAEIDPGTYRVQTTIEAGEELRVEQGGRELGRWPLTVLADLGPQVEFARAPAPTEYGVLRIDYRARDDFGVEGVRAVIRRADGLTGPGDIAAIELALPPPHPDAKAGGGVGFHDLTPHPWAGIPVQITLEAIDALDQVGASEAAVMTLPERVFNHPVARAIVEQRRHLTLAPGNRLPVVRALNRIAADTGAYDGDFVVALALRVAARRLIDDALPRVIGEVQSLLWDTALRVEEGELAILAQRLREAQQALQDALAGDATDEEIRRLMDQLQQLMSQYLDELIRQAERQAEEGEMQPLNPSAMQLERQDLQRLLDRARELAEVGARDAARELLARLQEMLENLQTALQSGERGDAEAMQMLRDLDALTGRQQELLERSFRQSQQMPSDGGFDTGEDAARQELLRRGLGELMRRFGEATGDIPMPLGRAERAMRDAVEALERGEPGTAVDPQSQALAELQQGAREMLDKLLQRLGRDSGQDVGVDRFGRLRDPLGRDERGMGVMDTGDVKIPEQGDVQRARQILDELRRRLGERQRPKPERDYIERLLPKF